MNPPASQSNITIPQALAHKFIVASFIPAVIACTITWSLGPLIPWLIVSLFLIAFFDGRRTKQSMN